MLTSNWPHPGVQSRPSPGPLFLDQLDNGAGPRQFAGGGSVAPPACAPVCSGREKRPQIIALEAPPDRTPRVALLLTEQMRAEQYPSPARTENKRKTNATGVPEGCPQTVFPRPETTVVRETSGFAERGARRWAHPEHLASFGCT